MVDVPSGRLDDVTLNVGVTEDGEIIFGISNEAVRISFMLFSWEATDLANALTQSAAVAEEFNDANQEVN